MRKKLTFLHFCLTSRVEEYLRFIWKMLIKLYIRIECNDVVDIDVYIMLKRNTIAFNSS